MLLPFLSILIKNPQSYILKYLSSVLPLFAQFKLDKFNKAALNKFAINEIKWGSKPIVKDTKQVLF